MAKRKKTNTRKIIPIKPRKLIAIFERVGYIVSIETSKHIVMRHPKKVLNLAIPNRPNEEVSVGIIRQLINNAGISRDDYLSIYNNL